MKYRVQVVVGDWLDGIVTVEAASEEDAKAEAETLVRESSVEATYVWEEDGR